ncbi:IS701 family transposase [Nocardia thraciensis]
MAKIGEWFTRAEPRGRAREYVSGLVAGLERKNGWTLAERCGEGSPEGMQRLLRAADWDVDGVRDDVRDYVVAHLGDPEAVLAGDETGFLKKGMKSAGVQRQYSGTAGRTENCRIGVFLAYASKHGHALVDRELYVPESWTSDRDRCRDAGIPDEVEFATKPRQMIAMLERALAAEVPFAWFTADEAYGQAGYLRGWCEDHDVFYVMATRCDHPLSTRADRIARADDLVAEFGDRTGSGCRSVPARTARANTTGHDVRSTAPGPAGAGTGCWLGAASATPPRSPTTSATARPPPGWSIWPGQPGRAGTWKKHFSRPKARPGSTTTRSANGGPGMPTSPCRCSLRPGSRQRKLLPQRGTRRPRSRHDHIHATGDPSPAHRIRADPAQSRRSHLGLVDAASTKPGYRITGAAATHSPECSCSTKRSSV